MKSAQNIHVFLCKVVALACCVAFALLAFSACSLGEENNNLYGYLASSEGEEGTGFVSFSLANNDTFNMLANQEDFSAVVVGEYLAGNVYGFTEDGDYFYCEQNTFKRVIVVEGCLGAGQRACDMAYDYKNEIMFLLLFSDEGSVLAKLDLEKGSVSVLATCTGLEGSSLRALACDLEGQLYGIDTSGVLYALSQDGACTEIGRTGLDSYYKQSMTFNHSTETLYWARCASEEPSALYTIDTATGAAKVVSALEYDYDLTALYAEYSYTPQILPWISNQTFFIIIASIVVVLLVILIALVASRRRQIKQAREAEHRANRRRR